MSKKNQTTQTNSSTNRLATEDLSIELTELSEDELSQVSGGWVNYYLWDQDQKMYRNRMYRGVEGYVPELTDYL